MSQVHPSRSVPVVTTADAPDREGTFVARVLVLNAGSSSLKWTVLDAASAAVQLQDAVTWEGIEGGRYERELRAVLSTSPKVRDGSMLGTEVRTNVYARLPTPAEWDELDRLRRQAVGRVSQRAHLILLSAQHHSVPALATLFALQPATVRYWIHRFDRLGPAGLADAPRSGRPRKVSPVVTAALHDLLPRDPHATGFLATCWTVAMLSLVLLQTLGVALSASTLRRGLHRLGLSWRRPRLAMPRTVDPAKAAKQWRIVEAVVTAAPETAILYADESRIQLLPLVRAMWQWVGQQLRIPTPGSNVTRTIFGALNIESGQWTYLVRPRARSGDFLAFLEHLLVAHPGCPLLLIVDNFSSHKAALVQEWLRGHPRVQLHYLPTYCSHLNPVEGIWRHLKQTVAPNRLYGSMGLLLDTLTAFFATMTPEQALTWAGHDA